MKHHRDIEQEVALFRKSTEYFSKRTEGKLREYDTELDAAHDQINSSPT
jgi:hypothetical protein